jgi:hypothetical protein
LGIFGVTGADGPGTAAKVGYDNWVWYPPNHAFHAWARASEKAAATFVGTPLLLILAAIVDRKSDVLRNPPGINVPIGPLMTTFCTMERCSHSLAATRAASFAAFDHAVHWLEVSKGSSYVSEAVVD